MEQDYGFIIERIISRKKERICYKGFLEIDGLPCGLNPPLRLCRAEVTEIRTICVSGCGRRKLKISLACCVEDRMHRKGIGCAQIEVETDSALYPGGVRVGAQIRIEQACWQACGFQIRASVWVFTVITRAEAAKGGCDNCRTVPLYPALVCKRKGC